MSLPAPADFGGPCLIGECAFDAELLLPTTTYLGLPKSGSYVYGSWRDDDGNLLRALRGMHADSSTIRFLFTSAPGGQLARHERADAELFSGAIAIERAGDAVSFSSVGAEPGRGFEFRHAADGCSWTDGELLAVSGSALGPGVQWFNTWQSGACYAVTGKYRTSGTFLGRHVEGFVGHEIHYFPSDATWRTSPYGEGREICWQQVANEYDDGSTVQATFACGADGWGFAMVHDEHGAFHCTTDVEVDATVRASGYPERITYRFLDQSWTWRIDPQGERPRLGPGAMLGADGTCTRDGDARAVRFSMGNSDWWTDGRADGILARMVRREGGLVIRVVQWATGGVGCRAVPAVVDHPDLELVGALVYSDAKAGRDLGEVCGIDPIGVITTRDPAEIHSLDADCVLYMAQGELDPRRTIDDICALLASGKNVVSTALTSLICPRSMGDAVVDRLEQACATGGVSFHATGIEPGWASDVLPLTMSPLFRYIDRLLVQELFDYSTYDSAEMLFGYMGFGRAPDAGPPGANEEVLVGVFGAPLRLVADGLGATIDEFACEREVWVAEDAFDVVAGRIEAGTVAAQRFSVSAVIDGRHALTVEHVTRMAGHAAPDWPLGQGWKVTIEGMPSMVLESHIATHGEDGNDHGLLGTAMHAVHAVVPVCEADPGIRTFLDLPTIIGRHVLRRPRAGVRS